MTLFKKTSNFLKSLDLFGIRPSLYFQGKIRSSTNFGVFLSILLLTFTTICFIYFGQDLYYRRNPHIMSHQQYSPNPEKIVLDPELMPIIIELNSPFGDIYYTNPNTIYLTVSQVTLKRTSDENIMSLDHYLMEICRKDHFSKLNEETQAYFLNKKLSDYFCIPSYLKNLTMQGAFDQELFQEIKFTAMICSNDTGKAECLPKEEIEKTMSSGFIGIYFVDFAINPNDYENPIKSQPKEVFTNFVLKSQKEMDIFLKNNYIKTENGLVFEKNYVEKISSFAESSVFDFTTENNDFFMFYFRIKQESNFYVRSYLKLQDLLAQIGGFFNCFWIIALGINHFYINLFIIWETITNIFTIKILSDERKKQSIKENDTFRKKFDLNYNQRISFGNSENLITIKGIRRNTEENHNDDKNSQANAEKNSKKSQNDDKKFQANTEKCDKNAPKDINIFTEFFENKKPLQILNESLQTPEESPKKSKKNLKILTNKNLDLDEDEITLKKLVSQSHAISLEELHFEKQSPNSPQSTLRFAEFQRLQKSEEDIKNFEILDNLHMGFLDYIYYYTGFLKNPERVRKKLIIKKGSKILKNCLDIKYIIQKFYEIEKLKYVLLSDGDIERFSQLPRPELKIMKEEGRKEWIVTNILCKKVDIESDEKKTENMILKKTIRKSKFSINKG